MILGGYFLGGFLGILGGSWGFLKRPVGYWQFLVVLCGSLCFLVVVSGFFVGFFGRS